MGDCNAYIRELRFVIEPELLQVYISLDAWGDCPLGIQGWHHKTFPKSVSAADVLEKIREGEEEFILWRQEAP